MLMKLCGSEIRKSDISQKHKWLRGRRKCFGLGKRIVITAPPAPAASTFGKDILMNSKLWRAISNKHQINNLELSEMVARRIPIPRNCHVQAKASSDKVRPRGMVLPGFPVGREICIVAPQPF